MRENKALIGNGRGIQNLKISNLSKQNSEDDLNEMNLENTFDNI